MNPTSKPNQSELTFVTDADAAELEAVVLLEDSALLVSESALLLD